MSNVAGWRYGIGIALCTNINTKHLSFINGNYHGTIVAPIRQVFSHIGTPTYAPLRLRANFNHVVDC